MRETCETGVRSQQGANSPSAQRRHAENESGEGEDATVIDMLKQGEESGFHYGYGDAAQQEHGSYGYPWTWRGGVRNRRGKTYRQPKERNGNPAQRGGRGGRSGPREGSFGDGTEMNGGRRRNPKMNDGERGAGGYRNNGHFRYNPQQGGNGHYQRGFKDRDGYGRREGAGKT